MGTVKSNIWLNILILQFVAINISNNEFMSTSELMMLGYGDKCRGLQEFCNLFNNTHSERYSISKLNASKSFSQTENNTKTQKMW